MIRASNLHRFRNCSGAPAAEKDIPDPPDKIWTGEGTIVHGLLNGTVLAKDVENEDLLDIADRMEAIASHILEKILPEGQEGYERLEVIKDRDEPYFVEYGGEKIISGHPDFIQIGTIFGKRVAVILDYKSGYLEVPAPELNDQLRSYAVMVWQAFAGIEEVYASIVPRFGAPPVPVHYDSNDLMRAVLDLVDVEKASRDAKAIRKPSVDACRYCRARATSRCPETLHIDPKLITMNSLIDLTPAQKGELLDLSTIATGNIKRLKERLEEELRDDPNAVEGWHLVPGDIKGSIKDSDACYQLVSEFMTVEAFQACLKVAQKPLKDAIKDYLVTNGCAKKNAAARIKEILAPVTVFTQNKPSLEKKP